MKKIALMLILVLVFMGAGCAPEEDDAFASIDQGIRDDLISFLKSAALGGSGEYTVTVEGDVGQDTVGEVTGTAAGSPAGAEVISFSFLDNTLIEVGRAAVTDGQWGPLTVLYGPKAMVLAAGDEILGYWLTPQAFAMAPMTAVTKHKDFLVSPEESGLIALALACSGEYQEAADLLAAMRPVHLEYKGLPLKADVFGRSQSQGIDPAATAWAGYAAAALAEATDNSNLWEEARSYALYLRDLEVPAETDARLAGWLLFSALTQQYPEFGYLPEQWQPEAVEEYSPLVGTWMLLSGQETAEYVDFDYTPVSAAEKWIHYNLLAALDHLGDLELSLESVSGGQAVTQEGKISLEATSWMLLAISGKFR